MDNTEKTPLVHHMSGLDQTRAAYVASGRTRQLWPETPDGSMAHAVFSELLKDLADPKQHHKACKDWHWSGDHWYLDAFGVDRSYLHNMMIRWGFIPDNIPLHHEHNYSYGAQDTGKTKRCKTCGVSKDLNEFHSDKTQSDGKKGHCKPCANAAKYEKKANRGEA